jgi:hypothetical protein
LQACDKVLYPTVVTLFGHIVMMVMFVFIGPLPFLSIKPTLTLIEVMTGLYGLGYAPVKVSSFVRSQNAAIKSGFDDTIETYSQISGRNQIWFILNLFLFVRLLNFLFINLQSF